MFSIFKKSKWERSLQFISAKFGLTLRDLPDSSTIEGIFHEYIETHDLSQEAATALLLRLFVLNFLAAGSIMKDAGENIHPKDYLFLLDLINLSVDLSETARDHVKLESVTSKLNVTIEMFLEKIGIKKG